MAHADAAITEPDFFDTVLDQHQQLLANAQIVLPALQLDQAMAEQGQRLIVAVLQRQQRLFEFRECADPSPEHSQEVAALCCRDHPLDHQVHEDCLASVWIAALLPP